MKLKDRKLLATLMADQNVSARQLAGVAGWKSHSHMNRLLSGEASTLKHEAAARIAKYLGVSVRVLFVPSASSDAVQTVRGRGAA
jgi:transcriptional regulator with XRE-family HTH domain